MLVPSSELRRVPATASLGLLSSGTPGRPIVRSRGVTPSSVAPECLGDSKSRAGTQIHLYTSIVRMRGATAVAGSMVAMTKPVSRDAKQKGPKESTDRALVNCASGKHRSRPIKPMSLDMSLEHWCRAKVMSLQVLLCSFAASKVHSLGASARLYLSCAAHGKGWE